MSALRVTVDRDSGAVAAAIEQAARTVPLLVLTGRALSALADELGSMEAAAEHLCRVATEIRKPVCVNIQTADGSSTGFISPRGWSDERLAGWAAGKREELERLFGPATPGVRRWKS